MKNPSDSIYPLGNSGPFCPNDANRNVKLRRRTYLTFRTTGSVPVFLQPIFEIANTYNIENVVFCSKQADHFPVSRAWPAHPIVISIVTPTKNVPYLQLIFYSFRKQNKINRW